MHFAKFFVGFLFATLVHASIRQCPENSLPLDLVYVAAGTAGNVLLATSPPSLALAGAFKALEAASSTIKADCSSTILDMLQEKTSALMAQNNLNFDYVLRALDAAQCSNERKTLDEIVQKVEISLNDYLVWRNTSEDELYVESSRRYLKEAILNLLTFINGQSLERTIQHCLRFNGNLISKFIRETTKLIDDTILLYSSYEFAKFRRVNKTSELFNTTVFRNYTLNRINWIGWSWNSVIDRNQLVKLVPDVLRKFSGNRILTELEEAFPSFEFQVFYYDDTFYKQNWISCNIDSAISANRNEKLSVFHVQEVDRPECGMIKFGPVLNAQGEPVKIVVSYFNKRSLFRSSNLNHRHTNRERGFCQLKKEFQYITNRHSMCGQIFATDENLWILGEDRITNRIYKNLEVNIRRYIIPSPEYSRRVCYACDEYVDGIQITAHFNKSLHYDIQMPIKMIVPIL